MSRAERRLCKKAKHPFAKVMPDGSIVCVNCDTLLRPADREVPNDH